MTDSGHSHERNYPVINGARESLLRSYVDMMTRLNGDIARELKRARGLSKGGPSLVLYGASSERDDVLRKGHTPDELEKAVRKEQKGHRAYDRTDPRTHKIVHVEQKGVVDPEEVAKPRSKKPEDPKTGRTKKPETGQPPEIKGAWYGDESGNSRFIAEPTGNFTRKLTTEEIADLPSSLVAQITELYGATIREMCTFGAEEGYGLDYRVIDTLKQAAFDAINEGITAEEAFVNLYIQGQSSSHAEDLDPAEASFLRNRALMLFGNAVNVFKEVAEHPKWKKRFESLLFLQKNEAIKTANKIKRQKETLDGTFDDMMSEDVDDAAIKAISVMHHMGMLFMPETTNQALPYVDDAEDADRLLHTVISDRDRFNMFYKNMDTLSIEQQVIVAAMGMIDEAGEKFDEGGAENEEKFWQEWENDSHAYIDVMRAQQEAAGKKFSEAEFNLVAQRITDMAKQVKSHIDAQNNNRGGHVYKALHHGKTDYKDLYGNPLEVERIKHLQEEESARIEKALLAQEDADHKIDPVVIKGLKKILKEGYARKVAKGEMTKAEMNKKIREADLFSFQKKAVAWMTAIKAGILAYDAGLGKTPISIAYMSALMDAGKVKRGVLVLPAGLIEQWPNEIENFRPGSKVQVVRAAKLEDRLAQIEAIKSGDLEADFVIISAGTMATTPETDARVAELAGQWETAMGKELGRKKGEEGAEGKIKIPKGLRQNLIHEHELLKEDKLVQALKGLDGAWIFDEVHSQDQGLKTENNIKHAIAKEVLANKEYKFGMTATPIANGPVDMFVLSNLFHPGSAGESKAIFEKKMITMETDFDSEGRMVKVPAVTHAEDLRRAKEQIKPFVFMQRKTNDAILDEMESKDMKLPGIQANSHAITLTPQVAEIYDDAGNFGYDERHELPEGFMLNDDGVYETDREMFERLSEQKGNSVARRSLANRAFIRRQKAAISPKLIDKNYTGPQPKIDAAMDVVNRHFSVDENKDSPMVIFSSWGDSLELMKQELMEKGVPEHLIGKITGKETHKHRAAVQDAINAGEMKIVLVGIKAGGAGLNLQKSAFRNIFLDKPWTPAEMEQALGRTWRTGSEADVVHVHHMRVSGTTDEHKLDRLGNKASIVDALTFADMDQDYMKSRVYETIKRVIGSFDDVPDEWTPEMEKEVLRRAGLPTNEVPPLPSLKAFKDAFDIDTFKKHVDFEKYKKYGDQKIKDAAAMNDVYLKTGKIDEEAHAKKKRRIANMTRKWMATVGAAADHPVAYYTGEDFAYSTPGVHAVGGGGGTTKGGKARGGRKAEFSRERAINNLHKIYSKHLGNKKLGDALSSMGETAIELEMSKHKASDRDALAEYLRSRKSASLGSAKYRRYLADLASPGNAPRKAREGGRAAAKPSKPPEMHERAKFKLKGVRNNPFEEGGADWAVWEAMRRKRPTSYKETIKHVAQWLYEYNQDADEPYTKAEAREEALSFISPLYLKKFVKQGLIEVIS